MSIVGSVPPIRVSAPRDLDARDDRDFVLYWMTAFRRPSWNFSLQRAVDWCSHLNRPLVVLEALRCDYPWASDRLHRFVIQGMVDNQEVFSRSKITYHAYIEPSVAAGRGLMDALAKRACVVVTDDFPCFFLPRMIAAFARQSEVRVEAIDSNGLLPLRAATRQFTVAHSFRRFLQSALMPHLEQTPAPNPLAAYQAVKPCPLPPEISREWPATDVQMLADRPAQLSQLPINHDVGVLPNTPGGHRAASAEFTKFLRNFDSYPATRNQLREDGTSHMSPYLHFGHISPHQLFDAVMERDHWTAEQVAEKPNGKREGWWGASPEAEAYLDQLITWRELGYNMCHLRQDYDQYTSLPEWALTTLAEHALDRRDHVYTLEEFEAATTHDALWNAAQRQLVREGTIHNYLRMLWGKKILHWSARPQDALQVMIELNNKYALDGRNPNSYSGIFWVLGRYDRAWGPERPIFGKIRYMTSDSTRRKLRVNDYLQRFNDNE